MFVVFVFFILSFFLLLLVINCRCQFAEPDDGQKLQTARERERGKGSLRLKDKIVTLSEDLSPSLSMFCLFEINIIPAGETLLLFFYT